MVSVGIVSLYMAALHVIFSQTISFTSKAQESNGNNTRLSLLNSLLRKEKYDPRVPPDYEKNVPTNVTISILLLSFNSVSETRMDYSVELFLTQVWNDERLHFANQSELKWLEVDSKMMTDVWVPDVYFRNEKSASFHDVTVPNKYMHLYPGGRVEYSVRLSLTLNCRMNLIKYPLDSQICPMWIQSYTYTTENVMFYWARENAVSSDQEMQVHTELPQFSIVKNITNSCQKTNSSRHDLSFACIVARFTLQRDIGYYIIQVYVPSILIVALSWVSFWLDVEAIPARVSLGVLTVLTLNTHGSTIQSALPKVSYIKAIDVWVVSSLIFVFAALLEFAYVNVLARRADKELAMAERGHHTNTVSQAFQSMYASPSRVTDEANGGPKEVVRKVNGEMSRHIMVQGETSSRARARRVDKVSRILFPLCFVVFNIIYWLVYVNLDVHE